MNAVATTFMHRDASPSRALRPFDAAASYATFIEELWEEIGIEGGSLMLCDGDELVVVAVWGSSPAEVGQRVSRRCSVAGRVLQGPLSAHWRQPASATELVGNFSRAQSPRARPRHSLVIPLLVDGRGLGCLNLNAYEGPLTADQLSWGRRVAELLAQVLATR